MKEHRDRQVVMGNIRQPQRLSLGMETTQKGENGCACTLGSAKQVTAVSGFWAYTPQLPVKKGANPSRVRGDGQEVIPTDMLSPSFGNGNVYQVASPSQELTPNNPARWWFRRDSAFLNQDRLGTEFGLQVQPTSKQENR
jgi:hypothetical protein